MRNSNLIKQVQIKHLRLLEYLTTNFLLKKNSYHGPSHWQNVFKNGFDIAKSNSKIDLELVYLFSIIHDSKRENESIDSSHGERAANSLSLLTKLKLIELNQNKFKLLEYAIRFHEKGKTSNDINIGCCWDSDRLDLFRVGIIPSKKYLSTNEGKIILQNRLEELSLIDIDDDDYFYSMD